AAQWRDLLHPPRSSDRHRKLAAPLQYDQAACLARLQATSTRGVPARLRRVAGCAARTGSDGHAGATANLKLTFHLDHPVGANQSAPLSSQVLFDPLVLEPPTHVKHRFTLPIVRL